MNTGSLTDADLIEGVAARDLDALAELHRRTVRASLGLALSVHSDREEAERSAADVSAAIWRSAAHFDRSRNEPGVWLYDVACRAIGATEPDAHAYRRAWDVYRAVAVLPEQERLILELSAWGGMAADETAAFLDLSPEEVDTLARTAIERVGDLLGTPRAADSIAGVPPPPELPPELVEPPSPPQAAALPLPRRHRSAVVMGAVILGLVLLGAGYLLGGGGTSGQTVFTVALTGDGGARGEVVVRGADSAGNWPVELEVGGLDALSGSSTYELRVTPAGKAEQIVGAFLARGEGVTVTFSVPVAPAVGDRWAVVVDDDGKPKRVLAGAAA